MSVTAGLQVSLLIPTLQKAMLLTTFSGAEVKANGLRDCSGDPSHAHRPVL